MEEVNEKKIFRKSKNNLEILRENLRVICKIKQNRNIVTAWKITCLID